MHVLEWKMYMTQIFLNHFVQDHSIWISLQVENLLFGNKGQIKLCDFGSATVKAVVPDDSWTALQRSLAEDEVNPTWSISVKDYEGCLVHWDTEIADPLCIDQAMELKLWWITTLCYSYILNQIKLFLYNI